LVVDDSKLMHKMYEVMLRQYVVIHALDGREALDQLRRHRDTDLIFLDINMPNMNGLEFLAEAKADPELADVPVVIISTEGKEEDTQRGLEAGAIAYIKKPFRSEEVSNVIAQIQERSPA
jgi:two-component system chemotaxis response regulator CheY